MPRLTRQQVIDTRHCPVCKALPGQKCKAIHGGERKTVHRHRLANPDRNQHARAAKTQTTNRRRILSAPHRVRDQVREKTDCPRCQAKRGEYCVDRAGVMRIELHTSRWLAFDALPPPDPA